GKPRGDGRDLGAVTHHQDIGLLQVAFGRRRQRAGAEKPQQVGRDLLVEELAMHAVAGDTGQLVEAGEIFVDGEVFSEPLLEGVLYGLGGIAHGIAFPATERTLTAWTSRRLS